MQTSGAQSRRGFGKKEGEHVFSSVAEYSMSVTSRQTRSGRESGLRWRVTTGEVSQLQLCRICFFPRFSDPAQGAVVQVLNMDALFGEPIYGPLTLIASFLDGYTLTSSITRICSSWHISVEHVLSHNLGDVLRHLKLSVTLPYRSSEKKRVHKRISESLYIRLFSNHPKRTADLYKLSQFGYVSAALEIYSTAPPSRYSPATIVGLLNTCLHERTEPHSLSFVRWIVKNVSSISQRFCFLPLSIYPPCLLVLSSSSLESDRLLAQVQATLWTPTRWKPRFPSMSLPVRLGLVLLGHHESFCASLEWLDGPPVSPELFLACFVGASDEIWETMWTFLIAPGGSLTESRRTSSTLLQLLTTVAVIQIAGPTSRFLRDSCRSFNRIVSTWFHHWVEKTSSQNDERVTKRRIGCFWKLAKSVVSISTHSRLLWYCLRRLLSAQTIQNVDQEVLIEFLGRYVSFFNLAGLESAWTHVCRLCNETMMSGSIHVLLSILELFRPLVEERCEQPGSGLLFIRMWMLAAYHNGGRLMAAVRTQFAQAHLRDSFEFVQALWNAATRCHSYALVRVLVFDEMIFERTWTTRQGEQQRLNSTSRSVWNLFRRPENAEVVSRLMSYQTKFRINLDAFQSIFRKGSVAMVKAVLESTTPLEWEPEEALTDVDLWSIVRRSDPESVPLILRYVNEVTSQETRVRILKFVIRRAWNIRSSESSVEIVSEVLVELLERCGYEMNRKQLQEILAEHRRLADYWK